MAGRRLALLIASDEFADPGLARLRAPQVDVTSLAEVFGDPDIGGFTVERLVNGTSQELRMAVNRVFAQRDPDDFVLVHVSSHGLKDPTGELFLATTDTRRDQLDATAVEAGYLRRQMDRSRARAAVLLLDCCYGGPSSAGPPRVPTGPSTCRTPSCPRTRAADAPSSRRRRRSSTRSRGPS